MSLFPLAERERHRLQALLSGSGQITTLGMRIRFSECAVKSRYGSIKVAYRKVRKLGGTVETRHDTQASSLLKISDWDEAFLLPSHIMMHGKIEKGVEHNDQSIAQRRR